MARKVRHGLFAVASAALVGAALIAPPATSAEIPALPVVELETLLDIAQVDVPSGDVALEVHADFPAEAPLNIAGVDYTSITASILPSGGVVTHNATPASTEQADEGQECKDNFFTPTGRTWRETDLPVAWQFKRSTTPSNLNGRRTQYAIRQAHWNWGRTNSTCTGDDAVDFRFRFDGVTGKGLAYNGVNTVEFGSLGGGALAVNYTWYTNTRILEVDLRFNKSEYPWTNTSDNARYRVENVATHELGHQIGLDDLDNPHGSLTMYGRISKGESNKTTLGAGDLKGATVLTP